MTNIHIDAVFMGLGYVHAAYYDIPRDNSKIELDFCDIRK
jgi:hypothetical protein